jgi:uncharacterized protein (DUF58 family)
MTDAVSLFDATFLAALERLSVVCGRVRAREGEGRLVRNRRGGCVEFAGHRVYADGDDPRHVDWAVYQRTGRLFVKEFEREDERAVLVLVDDSASMDVALAYRPAARLAFALAYLSVAQGGRARVGLCGGGRLAFSAEVSDAGRVAACARVLETPSFAAGTDLDVSLARVPAARRGGRSVVIVSDLLAVRDGRSAVAALARRGDSVAVLRMHTPEITRIGSRTAAFVEDAGRRDGVLRRMDAVKAGMRLARRSLSEGGSAGSA